MYLGVHTFPKGISLEVYVIAQLGFELAYFEAIVQHFSHYATSTQPVRKKDSKEDNEGRKERKKEELQRNVRRKDGRKEGN